MSDFISSLPSFSEAASGLGRLAFGAFGGVVLGDFVFSGFEVPDHIEIGGRQAMHVHKLPGGQRVIDVMGDDPSDIRWQGMILDGAPQARAQQLQQMIAAGEQLPLQWGWFFFTVVIASLQVRVLNGRVTYDIACTVTRNEATAQGDGEPSLIDSIKSDISEAIGISPATMSTVLSTAQGAVSTIGALIPGSPKLAQAAAALGSATSGLSALANGSGAILGAVTGSSGLSSMTAAAGSLAQSVGAAAYLGRAVRNLAP